MKGLMNMVLMTFSLFGCVSHADPRLNVNQNLEMPEYEVLKSNGALELRAYKSFLTAQVEVSGSFDEAGSRGFRLLAKYIFGGNQSNTSISMTAPVSMQPIFSKEELDTINPLSVTETQPKRWQITFSMPSKFTLESLPDPQDRRIKLIEQPAETVAVIVFSGRVNSANVNKYERQLMDWVKTENLNVNGTATIARYNDPFTFPWNRRNELMIKVQAK